jgi:hypothetical protein
MFCACEIGKACSFSVLEGSDDSATVFVPFVIDDTAGLLQAIVARLRANGLERHCSGPGFDRFMRAAMINDVINRKIYCDLPVLGFLVIGFGFGSLALATAFWYMGFVPVLIWTVLSLAFPMAVYVTANLFIAHKIVQSPECGNSASISCDTSGVYIRAAMVGGLVYLFMGIVFKAIAQ